MNDDPAFTPTSASHLKSESSLEETGKSADTAPPQAESKRLARAIQSLSHLRMFDALHYREYRLIWYAQVFASQATWMDQVARG